MRSAEVRFALFYGIATWGALAAVEIAACAVKPLAVGDYDLLPPYYLKFTAILLLLYLVVGALAGTITAYLLRWLLRRRLDNSSIQVAVTLGLAVFYIINLLTRFGRWEFPHYAAALVALVIWLGFNGGSEAIMGLRVHPIFTVTAAFALLSLLPLMAGRRLGGSAAVSFAFSIFFAVVAGLNVS